jgi:hypothetical protein
MFPVSVDHFVELVCHYHSRRNHKFRFMKCRDNYRTENLEGRFGIEHITVGILPAPDS